MAATVPELKNIRTIIAVERETRGTRSFVDRFVDAVSSFASTTMFIIIHVAWFAIWIALNTWAGRRFDPYPFNFLTLVVSLEAIVLTSFVLIAQGRLTQQSDRRAHLDLQINLLAEQELTAILKMLCLLADRAGIDVALCDPELDELLDHTNVRDLAAVLNRELTASDTPPYGGGQRPTAPPASPEDTPKKDR
ncbi:MAG TPA: DUF1003 domain-containing protein [Vicinamibacterales bacterium]|jgi:uncharacterized membrane protein